MPFHIIRNDITKIAADAIVNTANPEVAVGSGVDRAIYEAAGREELFAARREIGPLPPGTAAVTDSFGLDAKYIIHVSGPVWQDGRNHEERVLRQCYDRALSLAWDRGCESIAFPLLSTGTYGFPKKLGIQTAVDSFTEFLETHELEITLAVFGRDAVRVSGELLDEVIAEVDDEYVDQALKDEYANPVLDDEESSVPGSSPSGSRNKSTGGPSERREGVMERFGSRLRRALGSRPVSKSAPGAAGQAFSERSVPMEGMAAKQHLIEDAAADSTLDDLLKDIYKDSLEKRLQRLINKKGLKNSEVYAAANISKQYFSKLLKGKVKPSKEKMMALAVGLHLNLDEAIDLLGMAGYAFSPLSQTDAVVQYFIRREDYNVLKIDIVLFDYGLEPLS